MSNSSIGSLRNHSADRPRIVLWGTFDQDKPRVRIWRRAMSDRFDVLEIRKDVWGDVTDKSQVTRAHMAWRILLTALCWPGLLFRYLTAPKHDAVVVGYFGLFDVLAIALPARIRGVPVVWDAFLSVYDTVVEDRSMAARGSIIATALHWAEWLACRAANVVVLDTRAHAEYFASEYGLPTDRTASVMVGCEGQFASGSKFAEGQPDGQHAGPTSKRPRVLFYGQFIPLHGIGTIVEAARLPGAECFDWRIIGMGQESERIRALIDSAPPAHLEWIEWVPYERLVDEIAAADICLGVFGNSAKAGRVIPNKVFQILAAGRPLVTRDGPGMRELLREDDRSVLLVPPSDPPALLNALQQISWARDAVSDRGRQAVAARFEPEIINQSWADVIERAIQVKNYGRC